MTDKRATFIIPLDIARDLRYEDIPEEGYEEVKREIIATSRWHVWEEVIFRKDGKFWGWTYGLAATERQEHNDISDEEGRIASEKFPEEKVVIVYV